MQELESVLEDWRAARRSIEALLAEQEVLEARLQRRQREVESLEVELELRSDVNRRLRWQLLQALGSGAQAAQHAAPEDDPGLHSLAATRSCGEAASWEEGAACRSGPWEDEYTGGPAEACSWHSSTDDESSVSQAPARRRVLLHDILSDFESDRASSRVPSGDTSPASSALGAEPAQAGAHHVQLSPERLGADDRELTNDECTSERAAFRKAEVSDPARSSTMEDASAALHSLRQKVDSWSLGTNDTVCAADASRTFLESARQRWPAARADGGRPTRRGLEALADYSRCLALDDANEKARQEQVHILLRLGCLSEAREVTY